MDLDTGFDCTFGNEPGESPLDLPYDINIAFEAKAISLGRKHTCVRSRDGRVACWGLGGMGRLGYDSDDNVGDNEHPTAVVDLDDWQAVDLELGDEHTCAIVDDYNGARRVFCWGEAQYGEVGAQTNGDHVGDADGPSILTAGFVQLEADDEPFFSVGALAAAGQNTCAVGEDGVSVLCWGRNANGEHGRNNQTSVGNAPGSMPPPASLHGAQSIETLVMGGRHVCAMMNGAGEVRCWGAHDGGQLGNQLFPPQGVGSGLGPELMPPQYPAVLGEAASTLAAGPSGSPNTESSHFTCGLLASGDVMCWGDGGDGGLGNGIPAAVGDNEDPVDLGTVNMTNVGEVVVQVATGGQHSCVLIGDINQPDAPPTVLRCWGNGSDGALGYESSESLGDDMTDVMFFPTPDLQVFP
jgi:alpha-tubulin suppressor-like RCC1 family protein